MKIIGQTNDGFLVAMTAEEIAKAAGYSGIYDEGWMTALKRAGRYDRETPPIGMKIEVQAAYDFHSRVQQHEAAARKSAGTLRALADLLDGSMPSVVLPPPSTVPAEPAPSQE